MLTINRAQYQKLAILGGSIDTYPQLAQLANVNSIDTWYPYRAHPYHMSTCQNVMSMFFAV